MGPGETIVAVVSMVSLFIVLPTIIMRGIRDVKVGRAAQRASDRTSEGGTMRSSELKSMIRSAVDEATAPLAARITDLEERLGDEPVHAIRERIDGGALSAAFDPDAEFDDPMHGTPGRRARA